MFAEKANLMDELGVVQTSPLAETASTSWSAVVNPLTINCASAVGASTQKAWRAFGLVPMSYTPGSHMDTGWAVVGLTGECVVEEVGGGTNVGQGGFHQRSRC